MWTMMQEAERDPSIFEIMADPYALNPTGSERGNDGLDPTSGHYDPDCGAWVAPFVMGPVNTRVVRRTNALLDFAYGHDFRYDEATVTRDGPLGFLAANATGLGMQVFNGLARQSTLRGWLQKALPKPGEGPDENTIETGFFTIEMIAKHPNDPSKDLRAKVHGDKDPGYGSTSKMLAECAVALAQDDLPVAGGFWTPAAAMGDALLERLPAHAGVSFNLV